MKESILVRKLTANSPEEYFSQIAKIHQDEIVEGFLSTLGVKFLSKLYCNLCDSPYAFLYVAIINNRICGFICGSTDTSKVYKYFIMRNGIFILPLIIPKILSFKKIGRIFETLIYPQKKENVALPKNEILNFCISSNFQRKGIGKKLFKVLVNEFKNLNFNKIKIVTGLSQIKAQRFYESLGAIKVTDIEIHRNTKSLIYIYDINKI